MNGESDRIAINELNNDHEINIKLHDQLPQQSQQDAPKDKDKKEDKHNKLSSNSLSVKSAYKKDKTKFRFKDDVYHAESKLSLVTTTSDINSTDDAASIEFRLKQLVVEQEEKLSPSERYRSTPDLAQSSQDSRSSENDNSAETSCPLTRAKSALDLTGGEFPQPAFSFEPDDLPDVYVDSANVLDADEELSAILASGDTTTTTNVNKGTHRVRAKSVVANKSVRRESVESHDSLIAPFMRRNVSSSLLPERGNLRTLSSNRATGTQDNGELQQQGRNRSNTAGSLDKSTLVGIFTVGSSSSDQSMLNIRRSAWTLSDFDQTFNKTAMDQRGESVNDKTQYSSISDTPRGSTTSDRQGTSLLIKASKNAMAGVNQTNQYAPNSKLNNCLNVNTLQKERRPSNSHSIVSMNSSIDSQNRANGLSLFRLRHRSKGKDGSNDVNQNESCFKACFNLTTISQYLPILEWLPMYNTNTFFNDLLAGTVVAVLNISTSLSAAVVAETDFGAAFRASIVNTFVYAILCSSRHVSYGSWSIMSQMLLISVKRALSDEFILDRLNVGPSRVWKPEEYEKWHMNIIIMYTFLIGLVQLICGALNLGNILASFIPEALCSSMIAATAFTMAIGQLANMCGTNNKILWQIERNTTELWADLKNQPVDITDLFGGLFRWIQQILLLFKHHNQINIACVIISASSVILLFLNQNVIQQQLQKLFRRKVLIPFEMILLVVMILISYYLNLAQDYNVPTCGPIHIDFGWPNVPNLKLIRELWFNSLATALISYTMVYIMAKSYGNKFNYEVNYNQELIACGAGNLIGGLFDALPATASFSRTAAQAEAGGQTQMASIINCILLIVVARLLGEYVSVLPLCVMSAALFYGFVRMMTRFADVFTYWQVCRVDFAIWIVTFVAILVADMVNGFIFGFIFSILTMLYRAQTRRCYMLGSIGSTDVYVPLVKYPIAQEIEGIKIFQFCGPIHYVCADLFERLLRHKTRVNVKEVLRHIADQGMEKFDPRDLDLPTHIVLDFSMISYIDSAGVRVIKKIIEDHQKINVTILMASLASHVAAIVKNEPALWDAHKHRFYITLADAVHCAVRGRMRSITSGNNAHIEIHS